MPGLFEYYALKFSLSFSGRDVSHKRKGLRSFSTGQSLLPLNNEAFSIRKRESIAVVTCKLIGESWLCSSKNCFLLIIHLLYTPFEIKATFQRLNDPLSR